MAWYHEATSQHLSQCWPRTMLSYPELGHNELCHLKSPAKWLFVQQIIQDDKTNTETLHYWPFVNTLHWWFPIIKGHWRGKQLHALTSSWNINWKLCDTWYELDKLLWIVIEYFFFLFFFLCLVTFFLYISYFHHWNFYVPIVFQGNVNINSPAISFLETSQVVEISSLWRL